MILLRSKKIHTEYDEKYVILFEFLKNHMLHRQIETAGRQIKKPIVFFLFAAPFERSFRKSVLRLNTSFVRRIYLDICGFAAFFSPFALTNAPLRHILLTYAKLLFASYRQSISPYLYDNILFFIR